MRLFVPSGHIIHVADVLPFGAEDGDKVILLFGRHDPGTQERRITHNEVELNLMVCLILSDGMDLDIRAVQVHAPIFHGRFFEGGRITVNGVKMRMVGIDNGRIPSILPQGPLGP